MARHIPLMLATISVLALALAGCGDGVEDSGTTDAAAQVVVTTSILGDIAGNVLADTGAEIEVLIPPGTDPHGFAPSAADGVTLREADLVVAIGLGLEDALDDTLAAAEADGVAVLRVGELVDPIEYGATGEDQADEDEDHADEDEDGGGHADDDHAGGLDPHVWLDPLRAAEIGQEIAGAYAELQDADVAADGVLAAADAYAAELTALDEELRAMVATLPAERRQLVTNHDALGYLAARYDLEVVATVLPGTSADVDVTAGDFAQLVGLLRETGVPAVFAETTSTDRLAQALAAEVGDVEVVELYTDALGESGSEADTLVGMLRTDVERIVAALG